MELHRGTRGPGPAVAVGRRGDLAVVQPVPGIARTGARGTGPHGVGGHLAGPVQLHPPGFAGERARSGDPEGGVEDLLAREGAAREAEVGAADERFAGGARRSPGGGRAAQAHAQAVGGRITLADRVPVGRQDGPSRGREPGGGARDGQLRGAGPSVRIGEDPSARGSFAGDLDPFTGRDGLPPGPRVLRDHRGQALPRLLCRRRCGEHGQSRQQCAAEQRGDGSRSSGMSGRPRIHASHPWCSPLTTCRPWARNASGGRRGEILVRRPDIPMPIKRAPPSEGPAVRRGRARPSRRAATRGRVPGRGRRSGPA